MGQEERRKEMRIFAGVLLFLLGLFSLFLGVEVAIGLGITHRSLGFLSFICIGLVLEAFAIFVFYSSGTGKTASLHCLNQKWFYALVEIVALGPERMLVVLQDAKGKVFCVELSEENLIAPEGTRCVRVVRDGAKLVLRPYPEPSVETPQPPAEPEA